MLEPKPLTVGQELDALLADPNCNSTDALKAAQRIINEELTNA